jgi:hypothetical protein
MGLHSLDEERERVLGGITHVGGEEGQGFYGQIEEIWKPILAAQRRRRSREGKLQVQLGGREGGRKHAEDDGSDTTVLGLR